MGEVPKAQAQAQLASHQYIFYEQLLSLEKYVLDFTLQTAVFSNAYCTPCSAQLSALANRYELVGSILVTACLKVIGEMYFLEFRYPDKVL